MTTAKSSTTNAEQSPATEIEQTVVKEAKSLRTFFTKFNNDWCMNFAGLIAYNLLMAMLPIAIALIAILGMALSDPASRDNIFKQITSVFPGLAGQQNALNLASQQLAKSSGILWVIAILLAIFGGSRLFITIEACMDIIYRVRPRTIIRQNVMAIAMLLLFIILIPIMVFASAGPSLVFSIVQNTPLKGVPGLSYLFSLGGILGGFIASFILLEVIYVVVPNQRISWRNSWRGAVIAAIALMLFLILFPFYISRFLGGYGGQIGFAVILLLFFYYFAVILLLGAEVNAYFSEGVQPLPNDLATFVSTMAGRLNRDIPKTEAHPHQDPGPTDKADQAHIAAERSKEEQQRQANMDKQQQITSQAQAKTRPEKPKTQRPSKLSTAFQVMAGSMLAAMIEWFRLRHTAK